MFEVIFKAIKQPRRAVRIAITKLRRLFFFPAHFETGEDIRSASDNGRYVHIVDLAVRSDRIFKNFRRHPEYRAILEHTEPVFARRCIELIRKQTPQILIRVGDFAINDAYGGAELVDFGNVGKFSPSTLRYVKVLSDLINQFGPLDGKEIAEIGIGYGGQCLVIDTGSKFKKYTMFDLRVVLKLAKKYHDHFLFNTVLEYSTINEFPTDRKFDIVISNYAFSELPAKLQRKYLDKVISRSKHGYLTMNSGRGGHFDQGKLTAEEIMQELPESWIIAEDPLTYEFNYVIVW